MSTGTDRLRLSLDVTAIPARPAGAGRYAVELATVLARRDDLDLVLLARRNDAERWRALAADGAPARASAGAGPAKVVASAPHQRPLRLAWEQIQMPHMLEALAPDVHHGPHYTMPERAGIPMVVTVHDCTFFDHPEWHERSKVVLFRRAIRAAARHADVVICVSQTTADRLGEVCEVSAPVVVAPHGVDHTRFRAAEPFAGADELACKELGLGDDRPFVLYIGTLEPRKGVAPLVEVFDRVAGTHPDALLVLAGQKGWGTDSTERALAAAAHGDRIIRTGYVPDDAVPALLRRAAVVAYPALEEGFGLPVLEAMACGAPVITTEGTAMAEMAAGVARLVPPGDADAMADALAEALARAPRAGAEPDAVRQRGIAIAAERTWEASADIHVAAYRRAAGATPA